MKKVLLFLFFAILTLSSVAWATEGMTEEELIREALADAKLQENMVDRVALFDVNGDNAISVTEIGELITGLSSQDMAAFATMEIKATREEMAAYIKDAYAKADADGDKMLRDEEIKKFSEAWEIFVLKEKFRSMDRNGDGVWNDADMPTPEESMKKLEEATAKMQELTEKLEQITPEEAAQNMFATFGAAAAKEDFIQMDRDNDGCVTRDEYADYNVAQQSAVDEEGKASLYQLSREDYLGLFTRVDKNNPKCLTQGEYIADEVKTMREIASFANPENEEKTPEALGGMRLEAADERYIAMDKDRNDCVSREEFTDYNQEVQKSVSDDGDRWYLLSREDHYEMFDRIDKKDANCLTKDEFLQNMAKNYSSIFDEDEERRIAELMFAEMDENADGQLTREEYVRYEMSVHTIKEANEETFSGIFNIYKGAEKGWLTKEEFVSGYLEP